MDILLIYKIFLVKSSNIFFYSRRLRSVIYSTFDAKSKDLCPSSGEDNELYLVNKSEEKLAM